ncbi:MAG: hypothetical protein WCI56_03215 [Hyphomicrobiales bacterium]
MNAKNYSTVAATVFALMALVQFARAMMGWPIIFYGIDIPLWPNWVACVILGSLSVLGFRASRE